jgi:hypothetical protein
MFYPRVLFGQIVKKAHRRTNTVTASTLAEYKTLIADTTSDLNEHLDKIENRLRSLSPPALKMSPEEVAERERMQNERDSTKQCLAVCQEVSDFVDKVGCTVFEDLSAPPNTHQEIVSTSRDAPSAKRITAHTFQECKELVTKTISELEERLHKNNSTTRTSSSNGIALTGEDSAENEQLREEMGSIKQCLLICEQALAQAGAARTNLFEEVLAAKDSLQVIISTLDDLVSAKNVKAEVNSSQILGQMSNETAQKFSGDRTTVLTASGRSQNSHTKNAVNFEDKHGVGNKLG